MRPKSVSLKWTNFLLSGDRFVVIFTGVDFKLSVMAPDLIFNFSKLHFRIHGSECLSSIAFYVLFAIFRLDYTVLPSSCVEGFSVLRPRSNFKFVSQKLFLPLIWLHHQTTNEFYALISISHFRGKTVEVVLSRNLSFDLLHQRTLSVYGLKTHLKSSG